MSHNSSHSVCSSYSRLTYTRKRYRIRRHMRLKQLGLRAAQIIIICHALRSFAVHLVGKHRIGENYYYVDVTWGDPYHVPSMITAVPDRPCDVCAEQPHPVQDILKCLGIACTYRLLIQQHTLNVLRINPFAS